MKILKAQTAIIFCLIFGTAFQFNGCAAQKPSDFGIKSKKALEFYLKGLQQQEYRDFKKAFEMFDEAIKLEPEFGEANFRAGGCQYTLQNYKNALPYLEQAEKTWVNPTPILFFYIAEVRFFADEFETAKGYYKKFLDAKPVVHVSIVDKAKKHYENSKFGAEAIKNPIKFQPKNMGEMINTPHMEYLPYLTADEQTIFLTSRRPESTGGYSAEHGDFTEDFFYSEMKNGQWQQAKNLGAPVNTDLNEGAACFSPDGQWVYFTACDKASGFGSCDIYVSHLDGVKWSEPKNLGPLINTSSWDSQPCLSNDGTTLYFSSARPGGLGGGDIWYSKKINGAWTQPINMGLPINTAGEEKSPFLHADGSTFYFSSDGHPGFGNLDLFVSRKVESKWSQPENLGYPLNTSAGEGNLFINAAGTIGYMNSERNNGLGRSDIYSFELDERVRPSFTTYVRGIVLDDSTSLPLNAKITFINLETGDTIRSVFTNEISGKFLLTLPVDQDYAAFVDAKDYVFASRNFSLKGLPKNQNQFYDLEIRLNRIGVGETLVLRNIFYETNKFNLLDESKTELNHLVRWMKTNPNLKIEISGHTDNVGTDSENQVLSEKRAIEVKKFLETKGIKPDRVLTVGYGEKHPLCKENPDAEDCRSKNRRTELKIISK